MKIRFLALFFALQSTTSSAQQAPPPGRSFELAALQQAAVDTDPRLQQLQLLAAQSDLRLRNIAAARLPSIAVDGQAQYQSDVPTAPLTLPGGRPLFSPSKATYDSGLRIDQRLFDATINAQGALERAQLGEQQARVKATLFGLRQQVNEAFFAAAALQARAGALAATVADLDARLRERNSDAPGEISRRLSRARDEISAWRHYDYLIINRDVKEAVDQLANIIKAERCRTSRLTLRFPDVEVPE